jgi:hypothetical protein
VWFNFALDTLFFLGELEPFDRYGFSFPAVYFLRREDTARVRHVACAFEELGLGGGDGQRESEHVFSCLFHVVDRCPASPRLLISCTPRDLEVRQDFLPASDNVVQKLWWAWINGTSVVTSSLAEKQILMVREGDLGSLMC